MQTNEPMRDKLPGERASFDRRFRIVQWEDDPTEPGKKVMTELKLYVIAGMYDDGRLGELFIRAEKMNGFISGILDAMATTISIALQHGVPLQQMTQKYRGGRFPPAQAFGLDDKEFKSCTSPMDLVAQWLDLRFPEGKLALERAPALAKSGVVSP
jgi:hypothetical protein